MFARVTRFNGSADGLEKSIAIAEERLLPPLRKIDGAVGVVVLGDRTTGGQVAITLWASKEAMKASEEAAAQMRSESAEETGEEVVSIERFEVLIDERWG